MPCDERLLRGIVAATSNDTPASAYGLDCPVVGWARRNEKSFRMNHTDGWMSSWGGGGMWVWAVIGVAVVVLLVVVISRLAKK